MSYFDNRNPERLEGQLCQARDILEELDLGEGASLAEWRTAVSHTFGRANALMLTAKLIKTYRVIKADAAGKRWRVASNGDHEAE